MDKRLLILFRVPSKYIQLSIFNFAHLSLHSLLSFLHALSPHSRSHFLSQNYHLILQCTHFLPLFAPCKLLFDGDRVKNGYYQIYSANRNFPPLTANIRNDEGMEGLYGFYRLAQEKRVKLVFECLDFKVDIISEGSCQKIAEIVQGSQVRLLKLRYRFNHAFSRNSIMVCFHKVPPNISEFTDKNAHEKLIDLLNASYQYIKLLVISDRKYLWVNSLLVPSSQRPLWRVLTKSQVLENMLFNFSRIDMDKWTPCRECKEVQQCQRNCILRSLQRQIEVKVIQYSEAYQDSDQIGLQTQSKVLIIKAIQDQNLDKIEFQNDTVVDLIVIPGSILFTRGLLKFAMTRYSKLENLTININGMTQPWGYDIIHKITHQASLVKEPDQIKKCHNKIGCRVAYGEQVEFIQQIKTLKIISDSGAGKHNPAFDIIGQQALGKVIKIDLADNQFGTVAKIMRFQLANLRILKLSESQSVPNQFLNNISRIAPRLLELRGVSIFQNVQTFIDRDKVFQCQFQHLVCLEMNLYFSNALHLLSSSGSISPCLQVLILKLGREQMKPSKGLREQNIPSDIDQILTTHLSKGLYFEIKGYNDTDSLTHEQYTALASKHKSVSINVNIK
ncbi:hypothetical protein FGO68_gene10031 [Halteria grandinella]|uniref:Uncharacterized protein n=1 Tax=Halteria grandinella TaxID=5974 RepID=A0A8J8NSZ8_HALGN|nr:hypothetical protein FGO68_gene10031 [Halteria grandinella]